MEKEKKLVLNKKKVIILCASILVLVLLIVLLCVSCRNTKKSNEKELTKLLTEIGEDFYENYWYDGLKEAERQSVLERLSITGFHVDLENLGRYNSKFNEDKVKEFVNAKTDEECDLTKTKIIIYPNAPYGKKDYSLETVLSCGFEDNENK